MKQALKSIIIDDEELSRENIREILQKYCPEIEICGVASSAEEGRKLIAEAQPELVFLDIQMPGENGFQMLESIPRQEKTFSVVFVTAFDSYGTQAIKASAADYVLKPINLQEIQEAIERVFAQRREWFGTVGQAIYQDSLEELLDNLKQKKPLSKLTITHTEGFTVLDFKDIIRVKADNSYSEVYLSSGKRITASRSIKDFENILASSDFFRVHNSHLINLNFLEGYKSAYGGSVLMKDGMEIPVSRNRLGDFKQALSRFSQSI